MLHTPIDFGRVDGERALTAPAGAGQIDVSLSRRFAQRLKEARLGE